MTANIAQLVGRLFASSFGGLDRSGRPDPSAINQSALMAVRDAELNDLAAVVDVVLAAMPGDPAWDYRFPLRREYPEDHRYFTQLLFEFFIRPSNDDWQVVVVEGPDKDNAALPKITAVSVWDVSYNNKRRHGPGYAPQSPRDVDKQAGYERRDANMVHIDAFRATGFAARAVFFKPRYGDDQLHLQILGTHPDYQRHGYGSALCRWGMDKATEDDVALTLLASPMGFELYTHLEFSDRGTKIVQVCGEKAKLTLHAMDWTTGEEKLDRGLL